MKSAPFALPALAFLALVSPAWAVDAPITGSPFTGALAMHPRSSPVLPKADNNDMQQQDVSGFQAWVAVPHNPTASATSAVYFMAPDALRNLTTSHPARVELIYFDKAAGQYDFTYDSQDPAQKQKALAPLKTTGSKQWMHAYWIIPDGHFGGGLNGADFKLESEGPLPLTVLGIYLDTQYDLTPDSTRQPGVPKGDILHFVFKDSKIFPGTTRNVDVYVPKQYDGTTPACVWVDQDAMLWHDDAVFDNLIARKEVPVIIDIAISPGKVAYPGNDATGHPGRERANRQYEYDVVSRDYVDFLLTEIFPAVENLKTPDGRALKLSRDGKDCGISGTSSGGISAFTAAWERPDAFTRVLTAIGSFDNLHNGDRLPVLIRKTEPKPIRVFLQDGSNDLNWFAGDWFFANQRMQRALDWAGYENTFIWGDRGHDAAQAIQAFPDAMRFLWKGWPDPVKIGETQNEIFKGALASGQWKQVWGGTQPPTALAVNAKGEVFFTDPADGTCHKIDAQGQLSAAFPGTHGDAGAAFGSDGRLYQIEAAAKRIVAYDAKGTSSVILDGIRGTDIVALPHNRFYVSETGRDGAQSHIWLIGADGTKKIVDTDEHAFGPMGIDAPAYTELAVGDMDSHWIYDIQALQDGTLQYKQRYTQLEEPVIEANAAVRGVAVLPDGWVIAATQMGLQLSQGSIVHAIVPVPGGISSGASSGAVVMGGPGFSTIFTISGNTIQMRSSQFHGVPPPGS